MPVRTENLAPPAPKPAGRLLWLLLLPPFLLVALLVAASVRPLQLGPMLLITRGTHHPRYGWRVAHLTGRRAPRPFFVRGERRSFVLTGEGHTWSIGLGDWRLGLSWLRGHSQR